ncbi:MAG TPA: apolipoprotein N-acyltransferase [Acetobacteraceae bacterium]|nr:apolipoprotein N-acyltransferase [Acetobacteraceae bacterium]
MGAWLRSLAGRRADLAACLLGAASALALPPFCLPPVLLIAIPGLLTLTSPEAAGGWRTTFRRGFLFGFGHHLVGLYWVTNAILVMASSFWWAVPLAVPLLAAVLALFIAVPCLVARAAAPGWRRVLLLAGAWTLSDIARQFVLSGFPWNPLGSTWEMQGLAGDIMIQPASWVGVHGLTLATLILAATPALGARAMAAGAVVLVAWAGAGLARLHQPEPAAPGITVVIAQGNIPEQAVRTRKWALDTFARYLELTRQGVAAANGGRLVVVWPETASPFLLPEDAPARAAIAEAAGPALATLAGTVRFDAAGQPHNSLVAILPQGDIAATYDKAHLVPFGEYEPGYLPIRIAPQGFAPGNGVATEHVEGLPAFGALICYEAIFPAQVVDEADRPDWLVNITNDAWFGNSTGPRQHLAAARMRAVEEGLPLVRAANTGISTVFDARGHELGRLGLLRSGTLALDLPGKRPPTPFSRLRLAAPGLLALACCVLGAGLGRRRLNTHTWTAKRPKTWNLWSKRV